MKHSIWETGEKFEFFQALRVLTRLFPDREPVGYSADPRRELARFRSHVSLTFPASQIQDVELDEEDDSGQPQVTVNFMGLAGPLGVLAHHYTEFLLKRLWEKDYTLRDFLDLFNHRFVSLFYRAWEKYRIPSAYERQADDRVSFYLNSFIGMATGSLLGRLALEDQGLLLYAGLFNQQPRSASALQGILRDYFECPAEVIQYQGRWVRLEEENETRLGVRNTRLGINAVLGTRLWDRQSKFRVRLGPLPFDRFDAFLPGGRPHDQAAQLTRLFAGMEYDFDIQLVLPAREVPACLLAAGGPGRPRLGWSSWLKTRDFLRDVEDTVLSPVASQAAPEMR